MNGLLKFVIPPDQAGFSFTDPNEILSVQLDGGAGKYRKDILNSNFRCSVQWTLNRENYLYFRTFYNSLISRGADAFLIDLYVDDSMELTEHRVHFVPGSTGLKSQSGLSFVVGAVLEVHPIEYSLEDNSDAQKYQYYVDRVNDALMLSTFGKDWQNYLETFDYLINTKIPQDSNQ